MNVKNRISNIGSLKLQSYVGIRLITKKQFYYYWPLESVNACHIFLLVHLNSSTTLPNLVSCVRIHCWKPRCSSCYPGAASS